MFGHTDTLKDGLDRMPASRTTSLRRSLRSAFTTYCRNTAVDRFPCKSLADFEELKRRSPSDAGSATTQAVRWWSMAVESGSRKA